MSVAGSDADSVSTAESKRLYAKMDREAKHLSPEDLAVFTATKGRHAKRRRLRDLFLTKGSLATAVNIFQTEEQIERTKASKSWVPMTLQELKTKFGEDAGMKKADELENSGDYEKDNLDPTNKNLWLYRVYSGVVKVEEQEKLTSFGQHFKTKLEPGAALPNMLSDDHDDYDPDKEMTGAPVAKGKSKAAGKKKPAKAKPELPQFVKDATNLASKSEKEVVALKKMVESAESFPEMKETSAIMTVEIKKAVTAIQELRDGRACEADEEEMTVLAVAVKNLLENRDLERRKAMVKSCLRLGSKAPSHA